MEFQEELSAKLLEFLESPHATTDVLLADKEQVFSSFDFFSCKNVHILKLHTFLMELFVTLTTEGEKAQIEGYT